MAEGIAPSRARPAASPPAADPASNPGHPSNLQTNATAGPSNPRKRKVMEPSVKIEIDIEDEEERELEVRFPL